MSSACLFIVIPIILVYIAICFVVVRDCFVSGNEIDDHDSRSRMAHLAIFGMPRIRSDNDE